MAIRINLFLSTLVLWSTLVSSGSAQITFDWCDVGDPGNIADVNGLGTVEYPFRISKYEVTNDQYAVFLNRVAQSDPTSLFHASMDITRSGNDGSYHYTVNPGRGSRPVTYVSFFDAMRFVNWMENGQPAGSQGLGTTDDGAYYIDNTSGSTGVSETREANATYFLPSEDEWYKAAYFDPRSEAQGGPAGDDHYWLNPTQSDSNPVAEVPPGGNNSANYNFVVGDTNDVGAYLGTSSFYDVYDLGGNVFEWNDSVIPGAFAMRGYRGGSFLLGVTSMWSTNPNRGSTPDSENFTQGFRIVKMVPTTQDVLPMSVNVTRGLHVSGGIAELSQSDNLDMSAQRNPADIQSRIELEIGSQSPSFSPQAIEFTLEASVFARSSVIQSLELFDYSVSAFVLVDTRPASRFSDVTITANATGNLARFVEPTNRQMLARIQFVSSNPRQQFRANVDQAIWIISPGP